jgi:hypothetical protein
VPLTISTIHTPATDLGYLLVKRVQSFATTGGTAFANLALESEPTDPRL